MLPLPIIAFVLAKAVEYGTKFFTGGGSLLVAIISAVPEALKAVAALLKAIGESPLLAFLFGGALCGVFAFFYGVSFDATIRERHKRAAIAAANKQAEIAIAKHDAIAAAELAKYKARIEALEKSIPANKRTAAR